MLTPFSEWITSELVKTGDHLSLFANQWKELREEVLNAWTQNQDSFKVCCYFYSLNFITLDVEADLRLIPPVQM